MEKSELVSNVIKVERNSNFELMRIISMFMIVIWHFIVHGGVLANSAGVTNILINMITALIFVHVNSFVLLCGYFNHNKNLHLSKAIKLNNSVWFYSSLIIIVFVAMGLDLSKVVIFHTLLPISYNDYWFFTCYLILYLISPILNTVIANSNKEKMKKIIFTCFIIISLLPFLTQNAFYNAINGYSLSTFILLYFIGAYLKKYPLTDCYFLKIFTINAKRLIFISLFIIFAVFNFLLNYFGKSIQVYDNNLVKDFGNIFTNGYLGYNNPLLIFQSVCYLLFFSTFDFKNKFINRIAASTFGVYLITDNIYMRGWLYKFLGFNSKIYSYKILPYILICSIATFVICILIETIRLFIFKFIYNTKIANKNRIWYRNFLSSLGFKINW